MQSEARTFKALADETRLREALTGVLEQILNDNPQIGQAWDRLTALRRDQL